MTNSLTIYYNDEGKVIGQDLGDLNIVQGISLACAWAALALGHSPDRKLAEEMGLEIAGNMGELMQSMWDEKDRNRNT